MPGVPPPSALLVFAQQPIARVDVDAWSSHAERFFSARLGLADAPRTRGPQVELRFVVAPRDEPPGIRAVTAGPRDDADLVLAERAEAGAPGAGLALLARRCPTVWRVAREGHTDVLALRLAAIIASIFLGPIVDPRGPDIFGVKTARAKLESLRTS